MSSKTPSLIETHNALPLSALLTYLPTPLLDTTTHTLALETSSTLPPDAFAGCFSLVQSMRAMYKRSTIGWSASAKKQEMAHPSMRFLLLRLQGSEQIAGFLSFMVTEEEGEEVVYCYELHLDEESRGLGLGSQLIRAMEAFAKKVGLEKAMLTCFVENKDALRFYARNGYVTDEISPVPRRLRGVVKAPSYCILSKAL